MDTLSIIFTTVTILAGLLLIFGVAGIVSYVLGFRDPPHKDFSHDRKVFNKLKEYRYDSDTSLTGSIDHE